MAVLPPAKHTEASVENSQTPNCRINQMPQSIMWSALQHISSHCRITMLETPWCSYLVFAYAAHFTEWNQNTILQTLSKLY